MGGFFLTLAGRPVEDRTATLTTTTWSPTWTDGSPGNPEETYSLKCVPSGYAWTEDAVGTEVTGIPRGAGATYSGTPVTGLLSGGVEYDCYVLASNSVGDICSAGVVIETLVESPPPPRPPSPPLPPPPPAPLAAPGNPANGKTGTLTTATWSPTWTDGAPGNPQESYSLKCVTIGNACTAAAVGTMVTDIQRGQGTTYSGAPVKGLVSGLRYSCYVLAINSVSTACSAAVPITTLKAPPKPRDVNTKTVTTTTWSPTWLDASPAGTPQETYTLKCVLADEPSTASAQGTMVTGIPRGAGATYSGTPVTGLASGVRYDCYVIATNSVADIYSAVLVIQTLLAPSVPTDVTTTTLTTTTWSPTWTDGALGNPQESYSLKCVTSGKACTAAAVGTMVTNIQRGEGTTYNGTPVTGLVSGVRYSCYVLAINSVSTACSAAVPITTLGAPGKPVEDRTATLTTTTWSPTWTDGSPGNPEETYTIKCVTSGDLCTASAQGTMVTGIPRGAGATYSGTPVTGLLSGGVEYDCYVLASNSIGDVCSAGVVIKTLVAPPPPPQPPKPPSPPLPPPPPAPLAAPGKPVGDTTATLTTTTWSPRWTDGSPGNPQETYTIKCVTSGDLCTEAAQGTEVTGIPRGAGATYSSTPVTGLLSGGVEYDCYVLASNSVGDVCSAGVVIQTLI